MGVDIPPPGGQYCDQELKNVDNLVVAEELGVLVCLFTRVNRQNWFGSVDKGREKTSTAARG